MNKLWMLAAFSIPAGVLFAQPFSRDEWNRSWGGSNNGTGGLYEIVNVENGRVVDLDSNNGHTVIQFEPRGTPNQLWEIRQSRNGRYQIVNAMNGAALTEMSPERSTPVEAFIAGGKSGYGYGRGRGNGCQQDWRIESYRDGSVMLISCSGKALDVPNGTRRNGVQMQTYDRNGDGNQRFFLRPAQARQGRGGYRLENESYQRGNRRRW